MRRKVRTEAAVADGFEDFRFLFTGRAIHKLSFASRWRAFAQNTGQFVSGAK